MKFRKITKLAVAGTAALSMSLLAFGATQATAATSSVQPVTFEVAAGSLSLSQTTTSGTALVENSAVAMPETSVTDGRNDTGRSGAWTVTAVASNLTAPGTDGDATIAANQITLAYTGGGFTAGSGTVDAPGAGLVSVSNNSIDSVYTYTPTAELADQAHPYSGSYTGTITQTVT